MAAHKIIFVSQEISPYLSVTDNARFGKSLPQAIQAHKYEVRTFMPDFGDINERRNQLHEVIRLSGVNIPIANNDHPLVVKVASMQPSRIQVYFIDNDDYFQKLDTDADSFGTNREDNDERLIFFARGTMETARKLRWEADVMSVSGWMSSLVPLYTKCLFNDGPSFHNTGVLFTVLPEEEVGELAPGFFRKLEEEGVPAAEIDKFRAMPLDGKLLARMAVTYSDAVVFRTETPDAGLVALCDELGKPWKHLPGPEDNADEYDELLKSIMQNP